MLELKEDNLTGIVKTHTKVMVQYGAGWCGNCKIAKPKFKRLANENTDITFVYVDAELYPESRKLAEVKNLPTFASFMNGHLKSELAGNKEETIKEVMNAIAGN